MSETKPQTPETPKRLSDAEQVAALQVLQTSIGWNMVVDVLKDNQKFLEHAILDRIDPQTKKKMTEEEVDEARRKRALMIELMDTPAKLIKFIQETERPEAVNFDPYEDDPAALSK